MNQVPEEQSYGTQNTHFSMHYLIMYTLQRPTAVVSGLHATYYALMGLVSVLRYIVNSLRWLMNSPLAHELSYHNIIYRPHAL